MIINSTNFNNRHKFHACNHERIDNAENTKQYKQLHLVKARKLSKPKVPIKAVYDAQSNTEQQLQLLNQKQKGKFYDRSTFILNELNDLDEGEEIERLYDDSHLGNYLDVPQMNHDDRKISMPIIRKSSQYLDIPDLQTRKLSNTFDERRRKSSQVKTPAFHLPRAQSLRSRQSINLPSAQNKQLIKNDTNNVRHRFASLHAPLEIHHNRAPSLAKSEIPLESRNQDEIVGDLKFTTNLSTTGQCAMLKSYEDELYSQFKSRFPKQHFPRVNTPTFNSQMSATRKLETPATSSFYSLPSYSSITSQSSIGRRTNGSISSWDMNPNENEQQRKLQVSRQIEEAMEILDDLGKMKSTNQQTQELNNQSNENKIDDFRKTSITTTSNRKPSLITASNDNKNANTRRSSRFEIDSIDLNKKRLEKNEANDAIKKYEKWQHNWSKMLSDMF